MALAAGRHDKKELEARKLEWLKSFRGSRPLKRPASAAVQPTRRADEVNVNEQCEEGGDEEQPMEEGEEEETMEEDEELDSESNDVMKRPRSLGSWVISGVWAFALFPSLLVYGTWVQHLPAHGSQDWRGARRGRLR